MVNSPSLSSIGAFESPVMRACKTVDLVPRSARESTTLAVPDNPIAIDDVF